MREKLREEQGLTLVEMLCAVAILILLGLMLNTGLQMAVRSYQAITAQSEVNLLLSTLSDALADDLRYARDVETGASLENGQVMAGGKRVLPAGAYGNGAYEVKSMEITYESQAGGSFFTVQLKVGQTVGEISAETEFTVRCLSGPKPGNAGGLPGEENGS